MSIVNPNLGWERLRDVYYRIRECSQLTWDKDISSNMISISPFATAIATYPKDSIANEGLIKSIEIFTGSGALIYSIPWLQSNGAIVSLGWSLQEENLVVVLRHGIVRCYYNFEGDFNEIDLQLPEDDAVLDVQFFEKGCVIRTTDDNFIFVTNLSRPIIRLLPYDKKEGAVITGWVVASPRYNQSLKVFISLDNEILCSTADELSTVSSHLSFSHLAVSPSGDFIAINKDNVVTTLTVDFQHELSSFQCDNADQPVDLKWCANDAVIITFPGELKVIGPSDQSLSFYYDETPMIITEPDGLKLLSNDKIEFLSRVGDSTVSTFKLGSTAASAMLLDSIDQLDAHSPKVDENLTIIKGNLVEAIEDCINAAAEEFEPYWQKKLLRAAAFGKSYLEAYNPDFFIEVCNNLKILNNLRNLQIGMFLTYQEYMILGSEKTIDRLLRRRNYKLSAEISKLLSLPLSSIYIHWACTEIKRSKTSSDEEILLKILKKLRKIDQISFAEVSRVAFEEGRIRLSTMLINYEPLPEKQIPLLLEMEQDEMALAKAEYSGDSDIILYVLTYLKNKLTLAEFFKLMNDKFILTGMFKELFKDDLDLIKKLYHQQDDDLKIVNIDLSTFYLKQDKKRSPVDDLIAKIADERKILVSTLRTYDLHSSLSEEVKLIESQIKLLNIREKLCRDFDMDFYSDCGSLNALIVKLISMNQLSKVNKLLAKELRLNDKKMAYLVVDTYVSQKNFGKLYEVAKASKSPIGYEYHFKKLVKAGELRQASQYIDLCNLTYEKRMKMLLKCDDFKRAAEELFGKGDTEVLELIYSSENTVARRVAKGYLERLGIQK